MYRTPLTLNKQENPGPEAQLGPSPQLLAMRFCTLSKMDSECLQRHPERDATRVHQNPNFSVHTLATA